MFIIIPICQEEGLCVWGEWGVGGVALRAVDHKKKRETQKLSFMVLFIQSKTYNSPKPKEDR
jgi:hypothetical protein